MKTVNGIYLNLKESDYYINLGGLKFYFSSEFYLKKFKVNVLTYVTQEKMKFYAKYKIMLDIDIYLMIAFYKKVEKRGFRVIDIRTDKELTENVSFILNVVKY